MVVLDSIDGCTTTNIVAAVTSNPQDNKQSKKQASQFWLFVQFAEVQFW